jgi:hypothetical protein
MVQFREIKRIFKEVTGKRCRVFYYRGRIAADYVSGYHYEDNEPIYSFCMDFHPAVLVDDSKGEWILREHFKEYINN